MPLLSHSGCSPHRDQRRSSGAAPHRPSQLLCQEERLALAHTRSMLVRRTTRIHQRLSHGGLPVEVSRGASGESSNCSSMADLLAAAATLSCCALPRSPSSVALGDTTHVRAGSERSGEESLQTRNVHPHTLLYPCRLANREDMSNHPPRCSNGQGSRGSTFLASRFFACAGLADRAERSSNPKGKGPGARGDVEHWADKVSDPSTIDSGVRCRGR